MPKTDCLPYLPPEWAPQSGIMLTWPHAHSDWAAILDQVEPVFAEIGQQVSLYEILLVVCYDAAHQQHVSDLLQRAGADMTQVRLVIARSDDTWARDHGPLAVVCNNETMLLDFRFNGWGKKHRADLDDALNRELSITNAFGNTPMVSIDMVLEGGSIDVDGSGTLLTTEHCLLNPTRNPDYSREQIEQLLAIQFGIKRYLWLTHGRLAGDDTDGHIDTLARFCNPETIAYASCNDPEDEHYPELKAMEQELKNFRSITNKPYTLMALPWPETIVDNHQRRLPATYANFLVLNQAVLVPTYRTDTDAEAIRCLQSCFPDRKIIGIDCLPLLQQNGSLHCLTMQLPAGVLR